MNKIKIGVIFGGMSTENEVSCISGASVIKHLNKEKYNVLKVNTKKYINTAKDVVYMAKETIDTARVGYKIVKEFNDLNNRNIHDKANSNNYNKGYYKTRNSKSGSYKKSNIDINNKDAIDVEFEEV